MKISEARKLTTEQKIKAIADGKARLVSAHGGRYSLAILEDERPKAAGVKRAPECVRVLKEEARAILTAFGLAPNARVCPPPAPKTASVSLTVEEIVEARAALLLADAEGDEDRAKLIDALYTKLTNALKQTKE